MRCPQLKASSRGADLIDAPAQLAAPIIAAAAAALTEVGEAFTVGCSYGVVDLGSEAQDGSDAMGLADRRMYVNKRDGRASASRQSADVLSQALIERNAALGQHLDQVAALAREVAELLEMTPHEVHLVGQAAELHDVGKVAIPDGILNKPGPLADAEWAFIRRHPIVGERIISAAPALTEVAALVRSSHERFDGGGYPDGKSGAQIPRGAQVVAVCDSFDAMTNVRPYGRMRSRDGALAELQRCAGTQFDPDVVRAFQSAMARMPSGSPGVLERALA